MTSRRTVLAATAVAASATVAGGLALAAPAAAAGPADLLPGDQTAHLLRRATFGATPATLAEAAELGVEGWLDRQLNPARIGDAVCDGMLARLPLANADI